MKSRQEIKKQAKQMIAKDNLWLALGLPCLVLVLVQLAFAFNESATGYLQPFLDQLCSMNYVQAFMSLTF